MVNPGAVRSSGSMTWVRYSLMSTTLPRPKATLTQCLPAMCATPPIVPLIRTGWPADSSARPPTFMSNGSPAFRPLATTASTAARSATVAISTSARSCAITCCKSHVAEPERSEWSASTTGQASRATFTKPPMYDCGSQASSASPLAGEPSWTKSSSVVSLGRNVTVSWTKFRAAMRIASAVAGSIEVFDQQRPGFAGLAKAVEAEGAAGEHLVLRLGGQPPEPFAEHLRRARKEAVRVRIIGGPHDLVRPDVVGQHRDAALDRLERDPAIALEQLARPRL